MHFFIYTVIRFDQIQEGHFIVPKLSGKAFKLKQIKEAHNIKAQGQHDTKIFSRPGQSQGLLYKQPRH